MGGGIRQKAIKCTNRLQISKKILLVNEKVSKIPKGFKSSKSFNFT